MNMDYSYHRLYETSQRVNWRVEDIIGGDRRMDFSRPFLPESFARAWSMDFLNPGERLALNHIRAFGYLAMFELVERCILPFVEEQEHAPGQPGDDAWRALALAQFSVEEAKHIELFIRFRREFTEDFSVACGFIGPADEIGAAIRDHSALAMSIFVLAIEWATQRHYLESVRDDQSLDPQFKSLLLHHWLEESQHAKLDALVFEELAARASPAEVDRAIDEFLEIGGLIDGKLREQVALDLASLERSIGRALGDDERSRFIDAQHQAMRWTFLGSALVNKGFLDAIGAVTATGRERIEQVAPVFC